MKEKPRIFYGWYIVGMMIITLILVYGIRNSFSAFFPRILDEFNWYRGSTAIMLSLNIFFNGLFAPCRYADRPLEAAGGGGYRPVAAGAGHGGMLLRPRAMAFFTCSSV